MVPADVCSLLDTPRVRQPAEARQRRPHVCIYMSSNAQTGGMGWPHAEVCHRGHVNEHALASKRSLLLGALDDVAFCYDLISMLEHQLRTARALLDELRQRSSPVTQTSRSMVVDYCAELRAEAVEVVKASEMLQSEVCGPISPNPAYGR